MKELIKKMIYSHFHRKNPKQFYGEYILGSLNPLELKVFDLRNRKLHQVNGTTGMATHASELTNEDVKSFVDNGILIWESYFADLVDEIKANYGSFFNDGEISSDEYKRTFSLSVPPHLMERLLDEKIISLFSSALGSQAYLRASPALNITEPKQRDLTSRDFYSGNISASSGFASRWHRDTPFLMQYHVLLKDIGMNDPHMIFAKGSSKINFGRYASFASEEFIKDNFEVVHCIGGKGTIYLFNGGDGLHRMLSAPEGRRETLEVHFTKGNSILTDACPIQNIDELKNANFTPRQTESMKFFFEQA